jgi:hypothetical protein
MKASMFIGSEALLDIPSDSKTFSSRIIGRDDTRVFERTFKFEEKMVVTNRSREQNEAGARNMCRILG